VAAVDDDDDAAEEDELFVGISNGCGDGYGTMEFRLLDIEGTGQP
jgi:hypothetical protein